MTECIPIASVILPVFNAALYVEEAVCSILNQSFSDFELLIINDGSSDESETILRRLAQQDRRIKLIHREHKGLIQTLNEGIYLARGEYIVRMDADDFSQPSRLEKQINFLKKNPGISVCGCSIEIYEKPGFYWKVPIKHEAIMARMLFECCLFHPTTILLRKFVVSELGIYAQDKVGAEDYDLWQRMGASGHVRFANLAEPLVRYRTHPKLNRSMYKIRQRKVANNIRINFLKQLEITPTQREFKCHVALSYLSYLNEDHDLTACLNWLNRIEAANNKQKLIDSRYLTEELQYRWAQLCLNASIKDASVALQYLKSRYYSHLSMVLYNVLRMGWRGIKLKYSH